MKIQITAYFNNRWQLDHCLAREKCFVMQAFYVQAHYAKTYLMLMEPWIFISIKPLYHLFSIKTHDLQLQMDWNN